MSKENKIRTKGKLLASLKERMGLLVSMAVLIVIFSLTSEHFLTKDNISNLLLSISLLGIVSFGMTPVIISGGFDLAAGAEMGLVGVVLGSMMHNGVSAIWAVLAALAIGFTVGVINGFCISRLHIIPLITTLGTQIIIQGISYVYSKGLSFGIFNTTPEFPSFGFWGRGKLFQIPVPVILMFAVFAVMSFVLNKTVFGRNIYAVGGNPEAAHVSGIKTDKVIFWNYVMMGLISAFAGIILASKLAAGTPTAGTGYELNAVCAVVLGGASPSGGKGKVSNTLLAVIVLGILSNGFVLLGLSTYVQNIARGCILLVSVGLDQYKNRRRS